MTQTLSPERALIVAPTAKEITKQVKTFTDFAIASLQSNEAEVDELIERYSCVSVVDHHDAVGLGAATQGRKELKAVRCRIENQRKDIKAPLANFTKSIDAEGKRLKMKVEAAEGRLADMLLEAERAEAAEREAERVREEQERKAAIQARVDQLTAVGAPINMSAVEGMNEDDWKQHLAFASAEARKAREEQERRDADAEAFRLQEQKRLKAEAEQARKDRAELEQLREAQRQQQQAAQIAELQPVRPVQPSATPDPPVVEPEQLSAVDPAIAEAVARDVEALGELLKTQSAGFMNHFNRCGWLGIVDNAIEEMQTAIKVHEFS